MNYNNQFQDKNFDNNLFNNFSNGNSEKYVNFENNGNFSNLNNYQNAFNQINNYQNQTNAMQNGGNFNMGMNNQHYTQPQNYPQNNQMNQNSPIQNMQLPLPNNNQLNINNQNNFQPHNYPQNNQMIQNMQLPNNNQLNYNNQYNFQPHNYPQNNQNSPIQNMQLPNNNQLNYNNQNNFQLQNYPQNNQINQNFPIQNMQQPNNNQLNFNNQNNFQPQNYPQNNQINQNPPIQNIQQPNNNQLNYTNQNNFQHNFPQGNLMNNNYNQQNLAQENNYPQNDYKAKGNQIGANKQFPLPLNDNNNTTPNLPLPSEQKNIQNTTNIQNNFHPDFQNIIEPTSRHPRLYDRSSNKTEDVYFYPNQPTSPFDQINRNDMRLNLPYNQINEKNLNNKNNPSPNLNNPPCKRQNVQKPDYTNINPNNRKNIGENFDLQKQNLNDNQKQILDNQLISNNNNFIQDKNEMNGLIKNQHYPNYPEKNLGDKKNQNSDEKKRFRRVETCDPPFNNLRKNEFEGLDIPSLTKYTKGSFIEVKTDDINIHYCFKELLGKGSFGEVWRCQNRFSKNIVAIKKISKYSIARDPQLINQMKKEFEILKRVDHPNIMRIFEAFEDKFNIFIVTEYLKGGSLLKRMENKILNERSASEIMLHILRGLAHCHKLGVAHRDLKPENAMYETDSADSYLKLIDFGLSAIMDKNKRFKELLGSPMYMAPEVIKNTPYNEKCDIWSAGIILYTMLCGKLPFASNKMEDLFIEISNCNFTMNSLMWGPWNYVNSISKEFLLLMLRKRPEERLSAAELLEHPFLKNLHHNQIIPKELSKEILTNFCQFALENTLQRLIRNFLASQANSSEKISEIRKVFDILDVNQDGEISFEEFKLANNLRGLEANLSEEELKTIFFKIDSDQNGFINYNEFLAASLNDSLVDDIKNLEIAFNYIDKDKNGYINQDELKRALRIDCGNSNDGIDNLINGFEINKDGLISKQEFIEGMKKASRFIYF